MYKYSIPTSIELINDETFPFYLGEMLKSGAKRVFLCGVGSFRDGEEHKARRIARLNKFIPRFQEAGLEVGIWINGLGHGSPQNHSENRYQFIVESSGQTFGDSFCPLDENFGRGYREYVRRLVETGPDLFMMDDDYRLSTRGSGLGCFCPLHLAEMNRLVGENLTREEFAQRVFSGGKNKYRDAYQTVSRDSLENFARRVRETIDEVNPAIRASICMCFDTWDTSGTDGIRLARILAGSTKPYLRTIGAPYWATHIEGRWGRIADIIEYNRMQGQWIKDQAPDIEIFAEGDVYPRPRYNVPSRKLELYDMALGASGNLDGILKYMLDYAKEYHYETGYVARHVYNMPVHAQLREIFAGKKPAGVRVYEQMHKFAHWDAQDNPLDQSRMPLSVFAARAQHLLALNAISTTYDLAGEGCIAVFGENARSFDLSLAKNGLLCDVTAAKILTDRGLDIGFRGMTPGSGSEYFVKNKQSLGGYTGVALYGLDVDENAEVLSWLEPAHKALAYRYENADGVRVYVLGYDSIRQAWETGTAVLYNYYRQEQLMDAVEWLNNRPLPAKCVKNPLLYTLVSRDEQTGAMAVGLFNTYEDALLNAEIQLDGEYSSIRFVNCQGRLEGNRVILEGEVHPLSTAAFEVSK